jgi:hypothetical protein
MQSKFDFSPGNSGQDSKAMENNTLYNGVYYEDRE